MRQQKLTPRADYRLQESQRANGSPSLSQRFRELKSLTVESAYFSPEGVTRNRGIKYTANLDHARSVFRVDCVNQECVGGDFDLSDAIARAVTARQATVNGEMCCQGWLSKATIDRIHCHDILRFTLTLEYKSVPTSAPLRLHAV